MRQKRATIRDVAEKAGVSMSAVSQVLNGNAQHVGALVRERILAVVDELQYRPNAIARSMVRQRTATVGLVITEMANPLFVPVIEGVEEILRVTGYHIVLASAPDVATEIEAIETLRAQQVDGFIFMSLSVCTSFEHLQRLKRDEIPFVVINRCLDDPEIHQIQLDDWGAGYVATKHLIELGHRNIGTISGPIHDIPSRRSATERHRGWQQALQEHNISFHPEWLVVGDYTYKGGYVAVQHMLAHIAANRENHPTALFVASDVMAVGALRAMQEAGLRVPQDIAVVTTGNPPFAAYTIPSLTTLSHPVAEAGRLAAQLLLDWFKDGKPDQFQKITLDFSLTIRESCGAYLAQS